MSVRNLKFINTKKLKYVLCASLSAIVISLSGCGSESLEGNNENLNSKPEYIVDEIESIEDGVELLEQKQIINELNSQAEQSEEDEINQSEVDESKILSTEMENKQDEINTITSEKYNLEDLYFLDTSLIDSDKHICYILIKDGLKRPLECAPIDNSGVERECYYAGTTKICLSEIYKTIGLENNEIFYKSCHWAENIYEEESYFSITSQSYYYVMKLEAGSIDHNPVINEAYHNFMNIITPLKNVLNLDSLKESYTEGELMDLMLQVNSKDCEVSESEGYCLIKTDMY